MTRRHWIRGLLLVILGGVLGAAGALGYVSQTVPLAPESMATLPTNAPIQVTFGAEFLTVLLRNAMRREMPEITDLVVTIREGRLVAQANVAVFGQTTGARAVLRPTLVAGHVHVDVARVMVGAVELPLAASFDREIDARLHALLADLPVTITGIAVDPRGLIVTCTIDLAALAPLDRAGP